MPNWELVDLIRNHDTDLNKWRIALRHCSDDDEVFNAITQSIESDVRATIQGFVRMRTRIKIEFQAGQSVYHGDDPKQDQLAWAAEAIRAILADFKSAGFDEVGGPLF